MIYFVQDSGSLNIKIGLTKGDVQSRISSLQTGCPTPLVLLATCDGSKFGEAELHEKFKDARVNGEWFRPVPELIQFISGLDEANDSPRCFDEWDVTTAAGREVKANVWARYDDLSDEMHIRILHRDRADIQFRIADLHISLDRFNEYRQRKGQQPIELDLDFGTSFVAMQL